MNREKARQNAETVLKLCKYKTQIIFLKVSDKLKAKTAFESTCNLIKASCAFIIVTAAVIGICGTVFSTKYTALVGSGESSTSNAEVAEANLAIINLTPLGRAVQNKSDYAQNKKAESAEVKTAPIEVKADAAGAGKEAGGNAVQAAVKPLAGNYSGDPFKYPQCVWYVWGRAKAVTGVSLQFKSDSGRSAKNWLSYIAQTGGIKVVKNPDAVRENAIAVFGHGGEGNGHVVFIENVITDSHGNPDRIVISESNWGSQRKPSQKTMSWDEFRNRSDGSLKGYIYL